MIRRHQKNKMIFRGCFKMKKTAIITPVLKKYVFLRKIMLIKHNVSKA